jgi:hypothetical protein
MPKVSKIGIIVPHLGTCQIAHYAVRYINYMLAQTSKFDFVLFYEELVKPRIRPMCASVNISEIWAFDGAIISYNIENTITAINAICPKTKIFYAWDVEWIRPKKNNFLYNMQAYRSPDVKLIARSKSHADAIAKYSNRVPDAIIDNFNLPEIIKHFVP